ncbi:MAG: ArnT family glycosyltransferase [Myxococcota bacterium]
MKSKEQEIKRDFSYIFAGTIVILIVLFSNGPFGFLPINISIFIALILGYGWFRIYFTSFDEMIQKDGRRIELFAVILLFFFWFLMKVFCIHPSTTDENIYFYMAKRFSEGLIPYRDFFFAHPPMHLIIPAIVFRTFGFNIVIAKLIPVMASLISGIFLYRLLRTLSGVIVALSGLIYYLFAYQVLMASSDMTGVNLTIMFLSISVYYLFVNKPILSGIFSAFALSCGLYSAAALLVIFIYLLIMRDLRSFAKYLIATVLLLFIIFGSFYIIGRENFILGVFKYHTLKPEKIPDRIDIFSTLNPLKIIYGSFVNTLNFLSGREFLKSIYFHSPLYISFVMVSAYFIVYGIKDFIRRKNLREPPFYRIYRVIGFSILAFLLFSVQYSSLRELYDFYLIFLFYFMAIASAYLMKYLYELPEKMNFWSASILTIAILIVLMMYKPISISLDKPLFGGDIKKDGERVEYQYNEPHFIGFISDLSHLLYYKDYRIVGKIEPFYRHYIWNKNLSFERAYEIADYIKSNSREYETITGASTIAPLLALLSNRRISAEEIDTNAKRFKSGLLTDEEFFRKVCSDNLRYLVVSARSYFSERYVGHSDFLRNSFVEEKRYSDPSAQHFKPLDVYLLKPAFAGCGLNK